MQTLLLQFLSALIGGMVVYVFGVRKFALETRSAFIQKQLSEFYSPIAGYQKRAEAKGEVRVKVSQAASEAWKELCAPYSEANQPMVNHEELYEPYGKIIEYDNRQLREELMPLYRKKIIGKNNRGQTLRDPHEFTTLLHADARSHAGEG